METKEKNNAITLLAQGKSEMEVADTVGVSQSTISRLKNANKDVIQKETEKLLSCLPDITNQIMRDLQTSDKVSKALAGEMGLEDLSAVLISNTKILAKFMELSYRQKADILKAIGIYPSNTDNTYIQKNYFSGNTQVISPLVMQLLGKYIKSNMED